MDAIRQPRPGRGRGRTRPVTSRRPGTAPALGLRAGTTAGPLVSQTVLEGRRSMLFSSWLRPRTRPAPAERRRPRTAARPRLETLEDRYLLSAFTVTNLNDSGPGSLRQAVLAADANPGPDVIHFAPGLGGTIGLTTGQLNVTDDLKIDGPGQDRLAVSGNNASRVFAVSGSGTDVTIRDLAILNGLATGVTATGPLGPATLGGGILNDQASLKLAHVTLAGNQASGFIGGGGGVANIGGGSLTIEDSTVAGNVAAGTSVNSPGGGALSDDGSALTVHHSLFVGNQAIDGGAIAVLGGASAAVTDSAFAGNHSRAND